MPFSTDHGFFGTMGFAYSPLRSSLTWLSAIPPFTQINLLIAGDGGRQVTVRMDFCGWVTSMETRLDLCRS
jgi:hypothetical protein